MKLRKHLRDAVVIGVIVAMLLACAELLLRTLYPNDIPPPLRLDPVAYQFNRDYLVALKPNITKMFPRRPENGGYLSRWRTNNEGFRGHSLDAAPGFRVMVYGDSNLQARFSGLQWTFTERLEQHLADAGIPSPEVINAGVVGFGPDQSLIRFMLEAERYQPDLVIFHIFADNDFGDLIRNRLFDLSDDGTLLPSGLEAVIDPDLENAEYNNAKRAIAGLLVIKKTLQWLDRMSGDQIEQAGGRQSKTRLQRQAHDADFLRRRVEQEFQVYASSGPKQYSHFADHYDFGVAVDPQAPASKIRIALMAAVLKKARDFADGKGIGFMVLIQPSVIDLTTDNAVLSYEYLQRFPNYHRRNLSSAIQQICNENAIAVVNLFDLFDANDPQNLYFRSGNDHWNDRGQQLAARETVPLILRYASRSGR